MCQIARRLAVASIMVPQAGKERDPAQQALVRNEELFVKLLVVAPGGHEQEEIVQVISGRKHEPDRIAGKLLFLHDVAHALGQAVLLPTPGAEVPQDQKGKPTRGIRGSGSGSEVEESFLSIKRIAPVPSVDSQLVAVLRSRFGQRRLDPVSLAGGERGAGNLAAVGTLEHT